MVASGTGVSVSIAISVLSLLAPNGFNSPKITLLATIKVSGYNWLSS